MKGKSTQVGVGQLCRPHRRLPLALPPIAGLRIHSTVGPLVSSLVVHSSILTAS